RRCSRVARSRRPATWRATVSGSGPAARDAARGGGEVMHVAASMSSCGADRGPAPREPPPRSSFGRLCSAHAAEAAMLERGVKAEAGLERDALSAQGEHALDELDRQVVADAVGGQRELPVGKSKKLLA